MDHKFLDQVLRLIERKKIPFEEDLYLEFKHDINK